VIKPRLVCSLVDETGGRELGLEAVAKDLSEAALVVVVTLGSVVVDASDVDDDVTLVDW
jgi:hypothetical protein